MCSPQTSKLEQRPGEALEGAQGSSPEAFRSLNRAYNQVFLPQRLSLGLVVPIEAYPQGPVPTMAHHIERVKQAEALGFSALWLRDVPFNVPSFGDAGQVYDPFIYLGFLAAQTSSIALGVASIILPLRHPAHVAKAAASADVLSGGRLLLGVASGDRPQEYPALNLPYEARGQRFRESYDYIARMAEASPRFENHFGSPAGIDMLPKPSAGRLPIPITGRSQQSLDWLAAHGDGWMTYPRPLPQQAHVLREWRHRTQVAGGPLKPAMQPLYLDLLEDDEAPPRPIHLGLRTGVNHLRRYLEGLQAVGVNHVALNLRFNQAPVEQTLDRLAKELLPHF